MISQPELMHTDMHRNAELLFLHILGNMFRSNVNASAIRLAKVWTGATLISVGMPTSGTTLSCLGLRCSCVLRISSVTFRRIVKETSPKQWKYGFCISVTARLLFHASIPEATLPLRTKTCQHCDMQTLKICKELSNCDWMFAELHCAAPGALSNCSHGLHHGKVGLRWHHGWRWPLW